MVDTRKWPQILEYAYWSERGPAVCSYRGGEKHNLIRKGERMVLSNVRLLRLMNENPRGEILKIAKEAVEIITTANSLGEQYHLPWI